MEKKKYWRNVIRGPFYVDTEPGMTGTSIFAHHDEYKNGTTLVTTASIPTMRCHSLIPMIFMSCFASSAGTRKTS